MHRVLLAGCTIAGLAGSARAEDAAGLRPQVQLDGGLSVIGLGYEHPVTAHIAIGVEAFVFGTYFLPWFDAGDKVAGFGGGIRPTWFARESGRGLYVAPYFRLVGVGEEIPSADGIGFATGVFVGWAFQLSSRLDLRIGGGGQFIHFHADGQADGQADGKTERLTANTPFIALDAVLGYRL
ncbi:MAG: hypothetical protein H0T89_01615 [Deltaproteobacteria bacterium]|nr:hypothetical protein [Deltaproteobacteria bacterium]MDQ3296815.1 hypothetical protein [Myxococcota bacterium]